MSPTGRCIIVHCILARDAKSDSMTGSSENVPRFRIHMIERVRLRWTSGALLVANASVAVIKHRIFPIHRVITSSIHSPPFSISLTEDQRRRAPSRPSTQYSENPIRQHDIKRTTLTPEGSPDQQHLPPLIWFLLPTIPLLVHLNLPQARHRLPDSRTHAFQTSHRGAEIRRSR